MSNPPIDNPNSRQVHSATELIRHLFKVNAEFAKIVGEQLEVNPTDFKVMEHLMENGPSSPGEISKAVGITAGALTQSLDRLEAVGHTHRERNPFDRRSIRVIANPDSVDRAWSEIRPLIQTSTETTEQMSPLERSAVVKFLEAMIAVYETQLASKKKEADS
jgi:DNA-binding MarR family transcriptional regulator